MLEDYDVILASGSPRRRELLKGLEINFTCAVPPVADESFPSNLVGGEIPMFIAEKKAEACVSMMKDNTLVITADTIVWHKDKVYGKPKDRDEAIAMLRSFARDTHRVFTGCCIMTKRTKRPFFAVSHVTFGKVSDAEIEHYVDTYKPFDKAGAYGIQEWIGYVAVEDISGSFYNIMGLPLQRLYQELKVFVEEDRAKIAGSNK